MIMADVSLKEHFDKILDLVQENITLARDGLEVRLVDMRNEIDELKQKINNSEGQRKGLSDGWGWLASAIFLAIAIVSYLK